jgi:glycerophosphoryl diester phosphodiesterase
MQDYGPRQLSGVSRGATSSDARERRLLLWPVVLYGLIAWALFWYIELTMPVTMARLLATVLLALGFPVTVVVCWVLSGALVRRRAVVAAVGAALFAALLWINNSSPVQGAPATPYFIAHRGVHQSMYAEHHAPMACVGRIYPAKHEYIENTIPSIRAAFAFGARLVEVDIRPTADGDFAVFHDDLLDCKTEARGPVAAHTMEQLRKLDVGYGYFTEAGDHPLRGRGVGMMRSLDEILDAFPGRPFIIDAKFGNDEALWQRLISYLGRRDPEDQSRVAVFGASRGAQMLRNALPAVVTGSRESALLCARDYMTLGWSGYMPATCRRTMTGTYAETGWMLWGWPARFVKRMDQVGTLVILRRRGETEREFAAVIPAGYTGGIQTDHIESFRSWMHSAP